MWYLIRATRDRVDLETLGTEEPLLMMGRGLNVVKFEDDELKRFVEKERRVVVRDGVYLK